MIEQKIKKREELKGILADLKAKGKKIVFTNGCFDLLHYGHVKYLEEAKAKGDVLVVAVNSDLSIKEIKTSKRPIVNQDARLAIVAALESVDYVTTFDESTPFKTIELLRPDVLVKGGDWDKNDIVGSDIVSQSGGKITTIPFIKGYSTTDIIEKIKRSG